MDTKYFDHHQPSGICLARRNLRRHTILPVYLGQLASSQPPHRSCTSTLLFMILCSKCVNLDIAMRQNSRQEGEIVSSQPSQFLGASILLLLTSQKRGQLSPLSTLVSFDHEHIVIHNIVYHSATYGSILVAATFCIRTSEEGSRGERGAATYLELTLPTQTPSKVMEPLTSVLFLFPDVGCGCIGTIILIGCTTPTGRLVASRRTEGGARTRKGV